MKEENSLMDGNEIRERIAINNKIIEETNPAIFVLNEKVSKALKENEELRRICQHEYNDLGYCIYCDKQVD